MSQLGAVPRWGTVTDFKLSRGMGVSQVAQHTERPTLVKNDSMSSLRISVDLGPGDNK